MSAAACILYSDVPERLLECGAQVWRDPRACILQAAHASYQSAKARLYSRLKQRGLLAQAVCA